MEESSPSVCEEQHGSQSQALRLQKYDAFRTNVRTSSPRRVDFLPSRKEGPRISVGQKDGWTAVLAASSEPTRSVNDLISRTNFECSPGMPGLVSLKCSTQALHEPTLREKSSREIIDNDGTDTKQEIRNTVPFPGSKLQAPLYRRIATMGAVAAVCVQKRGGEVRNDVEQSLKDPVRVDVGS